MQKWRILLIVIAAAIVLGTTWIYVQQQRRPGSHVLLSADDYIEIHQLYSFYARDVDPGSTRNAAWMFADDAVTQMGHQAIHRPGTEGFLRAGAQEPVGGRAPLQLDVCYRRHSGRRPGIVVHDAGGATEGKRAGRGDALRQVRG